MLALWEWYVKKWDIFNYGDNAIFKINLQNEISALPGLNVPGPDQFCGGRRGNGGPGASGNGGFGTKGGKIFGT
jgi:hypothetical protein